MISFHFSRHIPFNPCILCSFLLKYIPLFLILIVRNRSFGTVPLNNSIYCGLLLKNTFTGFSFIQENVDRRINFWPMDQYHRLKLNRWIDGHRFDKEFVINDRYYRSKRKNLQPMDQYYRWSAWPIASIDSIGIDPSIHRRLCPSIAVSHGPWRPTWWQPMRLWPAERSQGRSQRRWR